MNTITNSPGRLGALRTTVAAILMATGIAGMASTSLARATDPAQRGVVMVVHSTQSSADFIAKLGLPFRESDGGRFAVVKLVDGAWGDRSFALVYVPQRLAVKNEDLVELESGAGDALTRPGYGIVAKVSRGAARPLPAGGATKGD